MNRLNGKVHNLELSCGNATVEWERGPGASEDFCLISLSG